LNDFQRGYFSSQNVDVFITFKVVVRANHLWGGNNYNEYQDHLYDLISNKLDDGWNYQQIADWLNENGYTSVRGKSFRNAHTHSIVKKKRLRDARMGKEYKPEYSNFQVRFVDKTLINTSKSD
tara:strand:+ start:106 stop:474 length:369 start_codon:yes stop_codon:yes gene_type:complete